MKIEHIGDYGLISGVGEGVVHGLPPVMAYRTPFGIRVELEEPIRKKPQLVDYDRYLHIADAEDWCTLSELAPAATGNASAVISQIYDTSALYEKRALVKCKQRIGKSQPFDKLVIDAGTVSGGGHSDMNVWHHVQGTWDIEYGYSVAYSRLVVRAITSDFDPATLTWNAAYVTDGGSLTFGNSTGHIYLWAVPDSGNTGALPLTYDLEWGSDMNMLVMSAFRNAGWDDDDIYGFEFRVEAQGGQSGGTWSERAEVEVTLDLTSNYDAYIIRPA